MKKISYVSIVFLSITIISSFFFFTDRAVSGTVVVVSDVWDYICRVQITTGMNAPNTHITTYNNVKINQTFTGTDRLCYRRSGDPSNCNSGWTSWTCQSELGSGSYRFSLN